MGTQFRREHNRRAWRSIALSLCIGAAAIAAACSARSSGAPEATVSQTPAAAVTAPADAAGARDFRRIKRYPGSWIPAAHDTFYVYCPDALATYRDFLVEYQTMEPDGDRIVAFFKGELKRSGGYRVVYEDKADAGGVTTWHADFRISDAHLMCRVNPSDDSQRDVYGGDVRLTVERGTSGPTAIRLEILLNLRADSPY